MKASIVGTPTPRTHSSQSYRTGKRIARAGRSDGVQEEDMSRWEEAMHGYERTEICTG